MLFFYLVTINDLIKKSFTESIKTIKENGEQRAYEIVEQRLKEWQKTEIKLAVTGNSGVGK